MYTPFQQLLRSVDRLCIRTAKHIISNFLWKTIVRICIKIHGNKEKKSNILDLFSLVEVFLYFNKDEKLKEQPVRQRQQQQQ